MRRLTTSTNSKRVEKVCSNCGVIYPAPKAKWLVLGELARRAKSGLWNPTCYPAQCSEQQS
jgi:hypothetical protein